MHYCKTIHGIRWILCFLCLCRTSKTHVSRCWSMRSSVTACIYPLIEIPLWLASCNDKTSATCDGDSHSARPRDRKSRAFFVVCVTSWSLVALYGVPLLGSHCNTINKPPKLSEATRLLATTPMSLFNAAEIKQNTLRMQSANYLKKPT